MSSSGDATTRKRNIVLKRTDCNNDNNNNKINPCFNNYVQGGCTPTITSIGEDVPAYITKYEGETGPMGPRGLTGYTGEYGGTGYTGPTGLPGSASAAFRACLDITTDSSYIKNETAHTGEMTIQPPPTSSPNIPDQTQPANYQIINYDKVNYNSGVFDLRTTAGSGQEVGEITINQNMRAHITYSTTIRGHSANNYTCFVTLNRYRSPFNSASDL